MPIYRYKQLAINAQRISRTVPRALVIGKTGAPVFVDVTAPVPSKEDLDAVMDTLDWIFVSQDPISSPLLDARSLPRLVKNVTAGGTFILTSDESEKEYIVLNGGALLGNVILEFPAVSGAAWTVKNTNVLGAFTVSLRAAGSGSSILLGLGTMSVWCDGTDL